jgi:hypothetical protein
VIEMRIIGASAASGITLRGTPRDIGNQVLKRTYSRHRQNGARIARLRSLL